MLSPEERYFQRYCYEKSTATRRAFVSLLIPLLYTVVFFAFGLLASITEFPTNRSGIYIVFAVIATVLLLLFPLVCLICSIVSIVYQVKALRKQESKAKNAVMMAVSFMYIIATIIFSYLFWQGAMSV